jgi:nucleoside-diphosphate-sugar epimerase
VKVFLTGATGVLGRRLVRQLRERGHAVSALRRRAENEPVLRALGAEPRQGDLFDADSLARAAEGAEVVIHAATAIPTGARATPRDFELNDRIRTEGTAALAAAAAKSGARTFLFQSIVWVAAPRDGAPFDEDARPSDDPTMRGTIEGERLTREAGAKHGFVAAVLRCGWFYAHDAAHTRFMGAQLARRRMPVIGRGDAAWSMLHVENAAGAFVAAAEARKSGLWHVVDDGPVTMAEFLGAFAERLGARPPRRVPGWLARIAAGKYAVDFLTSPVRASNARFRRDFGWTPRYPTYREGLDEIVAVWKAEGFLVVGARP